MNRFVHTIFCEDIRQETGGKFSLMGVLGTELIVPSAPWMLPKICASIWIVTPENEPFQKIQCKAFYGDMVIADQEMPAMQLPPPPPLGDASSRRLSANIQLNFAPFPIIAPGTLRVRLHIDDGPEIKAGALAITVSAERFTQLTGIDPQQLSSTPIPVVIP